jgi:transposase
MPRTHPPYALEYRRSIVELARSGRKVDELAREFEPSVNAIRKWIKQAELNEGLRSDGLTTNEREELKPAAPGEPGPARRTRDTFKSRGLVRSGDRRDGVAAFQFVGANQAMHRISIICRA